MKVFLLAGHSNIGGGGRDFDLTPEWNVRQDDVWIWLDHNVDGVGDWVSLEPGHGNSTHSIRPDEPEGITPPRDGNPRIGPELSLGRTLADAFPEDRIAIIKHAAGGGFISDWNTENPGPPGSIQHRWSGMLQKTNSAFEALEAAEHSYEVEGFFWSLGASDARNYALPGSSDPDEIATGREAALAQAATYGEGLTNFIDGVREEFGTNLPFIIAMSEHLEPEFEGEAFPGLRIVRESQREIAASDPFTTAFSTAGLTEFDNIHFDATGQIGHGIRFANAYLDLISRTIQGDYNGDGIVDVIDIDLQSLAMNDPNAELGVFDENADAIVDLADRNILVQEHANTFFGDSNLDGEFNTKDLVAIFQAGQYEDAIDGNSTWATGDWNGDRDFGTNDLVFAFQDGGFEQGPRPDIVTVPEPASTILFLFGVTIATTVRRLK